MKFVLGNKIRDRVSGLEGITTGYITYLNGCIQWNIHPSVGKDNKATEGNGYYDEQQLEFVDDGIAGTEGKAKKSTKSTTGGSMSQPRSIM